MTLLDLGVVLLIVIYVALGWWTGTVRRVIGLVAVYIGLLVAFNMGPQGGGILEQSQPGLSFADARFISWSFFLVLMLLVFEGAATAVHAQLQVAVLALNKGIGVLIGLVTAVVLVTAIVYMLAGFGKPVGKQPDRLQITVRDAVVNSALGLPLAKAAGDFILPLLSAALPRDPQAYFALEGTGTQP
ncbi:MAG: CvpA family protein [Chloroflexota bacterium]